MAWSDAARRAAALVRKSHAKAKSHPVNTYAPTDKASRTHMAQVLREYRNGVRKGDNMYARVRIAVRSTAIRNRSRKS